MPTLDTSKSLRTTTSKAVSAKQNSLLQTTSRRPLKKQEQQSSTQTGTVCNTNGAGLNVRKGPGTNFGRVGGLKEGAVVSVLGEANGWYQIQYGTMAGFVCAKYIALKDDASNHQNTQNQNTQNQNTQDRDDEPSKEKQDDPIGTATVTAGAVNVRSGAGYKFERIFGLSKGKTVSVLEKKDGWLRISVNDQVGWIYGPNTDFDSFASGTATGDESLANFIRDNYPTGFNICFSYNGTNQTAEFTNQATKFSKEYHTLNVSGSSLQKDTFLKIKTYAELKSGILKATAAVRKCLADHPRPGFDDARCSVIRNLTIMCHGFENGLNFGSDYFKTNQVEEFAKTVNGYLCNDVRVQLYACNTCRKPGTSEDWYERYTGNKILEQDPFKNGEGSFAQQLALALGGDASVYGHTTAGHLSGNYAARCYGKDADWAVNGKHMFDIYFPAWFVEEQSIRLKGDASTAHKDEVRLSMYKYYRSTGAYPGDNSGRDTFIDPEGKGERMRAAWLAQNP